MADLGNLIKERRIELGMTQDELAEKTGYKTRSSVNKIEKGLNDLPRNKIELFAKALNVPQAYFLNDESTEMTIEDLCEKYSNIRHNVAAFVLVGKNRLTAGNFAKQWKSFHTYRADIAEFFAKVLQSNILPVIAEKIGLRNIKSLGKKLNFIAREVIAALFNFIN